MDFLNYNSVETLPGYEARAAFTVNSATVFREDVDIVPTIVDDTLSYVLPLLTLDDINFYRCCKLFIISDIYLYFALAYI